MTARSRPRMSYQRILRAIGAFLDHQAPDRFRLLEVPDGFEVIMERIGEETTLEEIHFSYADLADQADKLMRQRRLLGSKYQGSWALSPTGRQDFLRAVGYELDDSRARFILVDESETSVLITYNFLDPAHGFQWRKNMFVLNRDQIEAVMKAAYARRHRRRLLRR